LNSVDKSAKGDYLISGRYTNCIYKVSGKEGSIIWRLGGTKSSFTMDGFGFSGQHDARFLEENSTHTVISFLNNYATESHATGNYSSVMIVALQTSASPMTAILLRQYNRPDMGLSRLRGNAQVLPNSNLFVGWSDNGYISEFTEDGRCVLEARFLSPRMTSYRAYKFNFTAFPKDPPTLKTYAYGAPNSTSLTVFYVSWNGATEVAFWNVYGSESSDFGGSKLLGKAPKSGFETMITVAGYVPWAWAEAITANGSFLGKTLSTQTALPPGSYFPLGMGALRPTIDDHESHGNKFPAENEELSKAHQDQFHKIPDIRVQSWAPISIEAPLTIIVLASACSAFCISRTRSHNKKKSRYSDTSPKRKSSEHELEAS
jgi:arylsulfotransferase ASST